MMLNALKKLQICPKYMHSYFILRQRVPYRVTYVICLLLFIIVQMCIDKMYKIQIVLIGFPRRLLRINTYGFIKNL